MNSQKWEQAKQLYEAALKIGRDERPRFLAENCSGDEELRREVESLLACSEEAAGFLDKPAIGEMAEAIVTQRSLTGQKILHYKILELLGAGGMGEVYLAEDTRLKRRIALKILPASLSEDKKSVQRFEQEACAASALNHPNILTVHEFGTHNGTNFIAAEYVEGETLRERLVGGKTLTLPETLDIALQVGAALRAAHGSNIIHRDIKPENVMIRDDGLIKVLDFGLAKLTEDKTEPVDSNRETWLMTTPGMIMGTAVYMSPEQARGYPTDARTDIWSLGVVLYEILAGRPPFGGDTASDTMASILVREPPPLDNLPAELGRILQKALQKDATERYRTVNDLISDLENFRRTSDFASASIEAGGRRAPGADTLANLPASDTIVVTRKHLRSANRKLLVGWVLLSIAAVAAFTWTFFPGNRKQARSNIFESVRWSGSFITWDDKAGGNDVAARFSPDGMTVAYVRTENRRSNIYTRQVPDGKENKLISDDKWTYTNPIWSPDGHRIAFISNMNEQAGIWSVPSSGGDLTFINKLENEKTSLLKWSRKHGEKIYFQVADPKAGLNVFALDLASKEPAQITSFDPGSKAQFFSISPDEGLIAYSAGPDGHRHIFVTPVEGGTPARRITNDIEANDDYPFWLSDGRIIYSSARNGVLQPYITYLDEEGRTEPINVIGISDTFISDVAADGSKILFQHSREEGDLWQIGTDGKNEETPITSDPSVDLAPNVSPDGKSIVFQSTSGAYRALESAVMLRSLENKLQHAIAASGFAPAFSPDGRKIAFLRPNRDVRNDLFITDPNGNGEYPLTTGGIYFPSYNEIPYSFVRYFVWSPDGTSLVFCKKDEFWNLWRVAADGSGTQLQISDNRDENIRFSSPAFAPDGKRIAWTSVPSKSPPDGNSAMSLYLWNGERIEPLYEPHSDISLIGWAGNNLVVAEKSPSKPGSVLLKLISADNKQPKIDVAPIIDNAYFENIQLSPDGSRIALSTREDKKDNIWIISIPSGKKVPITANPDPTIYISGIAWSPDGKTVFFSKQKMVGTISLADNVK